MKVGFWELALVFIVALFVIGPDKLPSFAQKLGSALREFRRASAGVTRDVRENVIEPLEEVQRPIREAMEPLEELERDVRQNLHQVEREFKDIGKPSPAREEAPERAGAQAEAPAEAGATSEENDANTGGDAI